MLVEKGHIMTLLMSYFPVEDIVIEDENYDQDIANL